MKQHLLAWGLRLLLIAALSGLGLEILPPVSPAQAAVVWPVVHLELVTSGLSSPVSISHADDQSGRLYIVEQSGRIRIWQHGNLLPSAFLDIQTLISCCGERGLLGLAFPADYAHKSHFYVYYTNPSGHIVIARYNVSADRSLADASSAVTVLTIPHSQYANHNGGQLAFGPDGYLYAGVGDGGSGGDPNGHGQSLSTLLAKILRIDVEGAGCVQNPPKAQNYCIPGSNPFVAAPGARAEIWAYGLRNPWRFSFDRQTGDLYIGDVGQDAQEEIDFQPAASSGGENYGWKILEGDICYFPASGCAAPPGYSAPAAVYNHGSGDSIGCAVTGGNVYRGPAAFLDMQGVYFYADYCKGTIYGLKNASGWQTSLLLSAPFAISTFGEDEDGSIYVADYGGGAIYRLLGQRDPANLTNYLHLPVVLR